MAEEKKFTGYGTCKIGEGEYTGELVDGVRQGYGKMKFSNKDIYDGDWDKGKMHSSGMYQFWDEKNKRYSETYNGEFNEGVREGKGKMKYANGDVYIGTWQNNQRTGDGICWFADNSVFHGVWKFDKMIRGVFRLSTGEIYDGEISNGKFHGYGKLFWPSGNWFEGLFKDNKPYKGMFFDIEECSMLEFAEGKLL